MVPKSKNEPQTANDNPSWYSDNKSMKGEDMEPMRAKAEAVPKAVVLEKIKYFQLVGTHCFLYKCVCT